jgi:hypothetical protein
VVAFPVDIVRDLELHLTMHASRTDDGPFFVGPRGGRLRRSNFGDDWADACNAARITVDAYFHDLRHRNTLAAQNGASTRELMIRMGNSTPRAALIYQHMTSDRDRVIADRMGEAVRKALGKEDPPEPSGTPMARPE